ncbi:hypothetical protein PIB30_050043 [Stylosanthes scabra]|uniref:Uncharacterized protein n=1 Tax=Stylosanthes scabra TaxID=79078 RepID=A0ABU6ZGB7_9FABA|nr:hypothetical protein [Stylosanthes scabra]
MEHTIDVVRKQVKMYFPKFDASLLDPGKEVPSREEAQASLLVEVDQDPFCEIGLAPLLLPQPQPKSSKHSIERGFKPSNHCCAAFVSVVGKALHRTSSEAPAKYILLLKLLK